jgi:hypothetical protein
MLKVNKMPENILPIAIQRMLIEIWGTVNFAGKYFKELLQPPYEFQ